MASDKKTPNPQKMEQTPETRDVMEQVPGPQDVFKSATQVLAAAQEDSNETADLAELRDDPNVADKFKGLPMRDLIGGPLIAAAEAQQNLAAVALDFYNKIAFEEDKTTRIIEFTVERPVEVEGTMQMVKQNIKAPFIGLVPIPSLLIDRIDIDFQMEVTDNNVTKSKTEAEASTSIKGGWLTTVEVAGKVSSSRENTRTTNQSAKYQVHVTASQQPQTEGLSKLMDIMASCIEPMAK